MNIPTNQGAVWLEHPPLTTVCPDSPANWLRFRALAEPIANGTLPSPFPQSLHALTAKENARLKEWQRKFPSFR